MGSLDDTESNIWDESDVQGFSFDDIETKDSQIYSDALAKNISGNAVESTFVPSLASEDCSFCNQRLSNVVKYEDKSAFCSEGCWIDCLRSSLSDLRSGGISSWPIDMFVSLGAKRMLIQLAAETLDGDFLIKVILIIRSRLDQDLFFSLLLENELGYKHYLNFLTEASQTSEADELMLAHGALEDSKISTFKSRMEAIQTGSAEEAEKAMHQLHLFAATELKSAPSLALMHESITNAAELLKFQLKIRSEWAAFLGQPPEGPAKSMLSELEGSIVGQNLANTILACVLMDKNVSKGSRAEQLKTTHKMSDEHFRWLVLEPLIRMELWMQIDLLLLEKKWLTRKPSPSLPIDRLILFLHSTKAPKDVTRRFLQYMPDSESLIDLVVRLGLYDLGLEHFIRRRDVAGLRILLSRTPSSKEEFKIGQTYLGKPTNQWAEYVPRN
ncbi:Spermatogenesis-defective protein 39 -like protein [Echinococcus granulosus]|nr:Spermatogenesis-defective protein 39 -like protein [Echinococcus granulosus]